MLQKLKSKTSLPILPGSSVSLSPTGKPFLKWAGGKSQLIPQMELHFPRELAQGKLKTYYEPFLGGGAMFFHLARNYPIRSAYVFDANVELVRAYLVIQRDVEALIDILAQHARKFLKKDQAQRRAFFLGLRTEFNSKRRAVDIRKYAQDWIPRAAQLIFLNKTCFNGLFRVNSRGEFNVPFGSYQNPSIVDADNLRNVAGVLKIAEIGCAPFEALEAIAEPGSFVYYDPPYRPISKTASFTAYSKGAFGDSDQTRLAEMFRRLDEKGLLQMLSNSDPKNHDPEDDFFDRQYRGFSIRKVSAARMINSVAGRRGKINELLITNY